MAANGKSIEDLRHEEAKRKNIPPAEYSSLLTQSQRAHLLTAYKRRNPDLDPQLVWRGKDVEDWSDLIVTAPPLFIQEKIKPKVLIDDLRARTEADRAEEEMQTDMFADFNGLPSEAAKTEFYEHDANWSNRMILGDSLQVMASLAQREDLRGQVQMIYIDPPYGIKFNSNFQWSTTSRDVKDGKSDHITREPEQVKAFRDTWRDGIHSYLTYLRDRLTVARDLLTESGSVFVQIGDENVHRIRSLMDEIFGVDNFVSQIAFAKTTGQTSDLLPTSYDILLWYGKNRDMTKFRTLFRDKIIGGEGAVVYTQVEDESLQRRRLTKEELLSQSFDGRVFATSDIRSQSGGATTGFAVDFEGKSYLPGKGFWKTNQDGFRRLLQANRITTGGTTIRYVRYFNDNPVYNYTNFWGDTGTGSFTDDKVYVVQTGTKTVARCLQMTTDPGDLVLDPTCGSGTTAYVAEQWGRRWITIDTSRVALALARARIMGARYPFYLLADSKAGQLKEAELTRSEPSTQPTHGDIRHGFVYERVPHITLKAIANNAEIDVIWERFQQTLEPLREQLNTELGTSWEEWDIPRDAKDTWSDKAKSLHAEWWKHRIARQKEIDASIAAKADSEYLYDKPYEDKKKVRVAGPFTVESLSPSRTLTVGPNDELIDPMQPDPTSRGDRVGFVEMILDNLRTAGVQQAHKEDKIEFTYLKPWAGGRFICAEGKYIEGDAESGVERRAGFFIGPEFGTVGRQDLVNSVREAAEGGFDVVIACGFNFEAHATELKNIGRIPVLKARMNADLHMAEDLKNTGTGNLFVIFGEPDIAIEDVDDGQIQVKLLGVDVFDPKSGKVRSDNADGIACWFIDTDYNDESFFVRHAYFLGQNDPYKALKTTLKAEINEDAWATLNSDTSRPFEKPTTGRIAVKVINHLGDEVMKVYKVK